MKTRIHGLLAAVAFASAILVMPLKARAHDFGGWHHDHGNHWGWYKHHGYGCGVGYANPGYGYGGYPGWHHHHDWDDDDQGYGGFGYGGPGYGYPNAYYGYGGYPYSGTPMIAPPTLGVYQPNYAPMGNLGNMGRLMRRQQLASQRLSANQALYQAAVSQGNYRLANKAAAHIQKQANILNGTNAILGGAGPYSNYGVPAYGAPAYYGQPGYGPAASPLGAILQMLP